MEEVCKQALYALLIVKDYAHAVMNYRAEEESILECPQSVEKLLRLKLCVLNLYQTYVFL